MPQEFDLIVQCSLKGKRPQITSPLGCLGYSGLEGEGVGQGPKEPILTK